MFLLKSLGWLDVVHCVIYFKREGQVMPEASDLLIVVKNNLPVCLHLPTSVRLKLHLLVHFWVKFIVRHCKKK